jgi:uncharacterized protein (TIGR00369 family)
LADFEPANSHFDAAVRASFARQPFMATLGASLERVAPGAVEIALVPGDHLTQPNGYVHAGALASIGDSARGYAALTLAPEGYDVLSVEFKINLLAPALGDRFVARARVVRPGSTDGGGGAGSSSNAGASPSRCWRPSPTLSPSPSRNSWVLSAGRRRRGPIPTLEKHFERISQLPKSRQRFVLQVLDSILQQAGH